MTEVSHLKGEKNSRKLTIFLRFKIFFVANHFYLARPNFQKNLGASLKCAVQNQKTLTTLYPEKKWFTLKDDFLGLCVSFLLVGIIGREELLR